MYVSTFQAWKVSASALLAVALLSVSTTALAQDDGNVLYLSEYLHGDFFYAPLGDIDRSNPRLIRPRKLRLPKNFRSTVELGNQDVSVDGKTIVFAARKTTDYDWDIYAGTIDLGKRKISKVYRIIRNAGTRDEDPRFSWDGTQIVYKCDGDICIYPDNVFANPVVESWCELWAPSFDRSGYGISYAKRCGDSTSDGIWQYNFLTGTETEVPRESGTVDRFGHFLDDGRIVYSHIDSEVQGSSLWVYDSGYVSLLHNRTNSDDDAYPDKHDSNHIAFIGWQDGGYNLFVYRQSPGDSVQLTRGVPILAPVLFR